MVVAWQVPNELRRGQVGQRRMWSLFVVMTPPLLNDDARLHAVAEVFHGQAFVGELAIETLIGAFMPRRSRL